MLPSNEQEVILGQLEAIHGADDDWHEIKNNAMNSRICDLEELINQ